MKLLCMFLLFVASTGVASVKDVLTKHCISCHGEKKIKGDVDLTVINSKESIYIYTDLLKNVLSQVESKEMPPDDEEPMSDDDRDLLVKWLKSTFHRLETTASDTPGPTRVRRLTGKEYDNTVKTLTGLDLKLAQNFPADGAGGEGFSNDSAILGVSPLQFEKYLEEAQEISSYSSFDIKDGFSFSQSQNIVQSREETIEDIDQQIQKLLAKMYPPKFTHASALKALMQLVHKYNKTRDGGALKKAVAAKKINPLMLKRAMTYLTSSLGKTLLERDALRDWFNLKRVKYDDKKAAKSIQKFIDAYEKTINSLKTAKGTEKHNLQLFESNIHKIFTLLDSEIKEELSASQWASYAKLKSTKDFLLKGMSSKYRNAFAVDLIRHIRNFLEKAHRLPPESQEVNAMAKDFITATVQFGMPMAARLFVMRACVSMKFIFRIEQKIGKPTQVTDHELANRLAYFLWSSPPDETLLKLAAEKKLSDKTTLVKQVQRMLRDDRSRALADNFAAEWFLFGEILESEGPDSNKYPGFDQSLAAAMYEESALCFDYIVKNDRSVLEIIDADYTFTNDKLRRLYGLERGGRGFQKTPLPDKRRGGVLGQASILTLTSHPLRTSPILRGSWIISSLLGTPTPPPPPNVPELPEDEKVSVKLTLKQQLEEHRKSPNCNNCHQRIDPVGFPLENYDPMGRWRQKYENAEIDNVGVFKGGIEVAGPEELKKYLMSKKDDFLKNMSRKMFGYALGRGIGYYDYYAINKMVENLKRNKYRFSALVASIVLSYQFQHKN
jgi:hypothetical protein